MTLANNKKAQGSGEILKWILYLAIAAVAGFAIIRAANFMGR